MPYENSQQNRYRSLEAIVTTGLIANINNCLNLDILFDLGIRKMEEYSSCDKSPCAYRTIDRETLIPGELVHSYSYRARLKGIATNNSRPKNVRTKKQMVCATETLKRICSKTSGYFICEISDIDTFNRILIKLYDPVTLECINDILLESHPEILTNYRIGNPPGSSGQSKWKSVKHS